MPSRARPARRTRTRARTSVSKDGSAAPLEEYRSKRDFSRTPEPAGSGKVVPRLYVIQKHAASRLHYDFRLELGDTLKSWALPKGPSIDPSVKRLVVHVEDHPVEYGSFEGVIPKGQYGGGTVMLWDIGRWEPIGDPEASYREGKLKFRLHGKRLRGVWNLVRMSGRLADGGKNWLLIKERDDVAIEKGGQEPIERFVTSVVTGRSMEEIGRQGDRVWGPDGERAGAPIDPASLPGARRGRPPPGFTPQLATLSKEVPRGEEWLHEIKLDGYRMLAFLSAGKVRLVTRNGNDWTDRFPSVARAVKNLRLQDGLLDGEVVALLPDGRSSFQLLQNALRNQDAGRIAYIVFDLPFYGGYDLRTVPLVERKHALATIVPRAGDAPVRYSDHVRGNGSDFFRQACRLHLEGIVSKQAEAPYESRHTRSWLKVKCASRQEFVIVGWTDPQGSRTGFGSLVLAHHDEQGRLVYSGKVGAGFDQRILADLSRKLARIACRDSPLDREPPAGEVRGVHWVKPRIVSEVEFTEWTADGRLRHPSFVGLREDKRPGEVVREREIAPPAPRERAPAGSEVKANPGRTRVRLTHPDRVLWPELGLTKADLAAYYESVAELMLPHVVGRPLAIVRCPRGRSEPCFFQKHASSSLPKAIRGVPVGEKKGGAAHLMIDDLDGLLSLVQLGALEIHPWGARADRLERPDRVVFDLDPGPGIEWRQVVDAALGLRQTLASLALTSFVRTSGGKGLHVLLPLERRTSWDDLKAFARGVAEELVRKDPKRYVATASKARREKRIFIDWLRNARGATAIAPYSTRAREGAPVAAPLAWEELGKIRKSDAFDVRGMQERIARRGVPWAGFFSVRQRIGTSLLDQQG